MIVVGPIGGAKMSDEHFHELILNLLGNQHAQQLQSRWRHALAGIVDEAGVSCEAESIFPTGQTIERAVVDALLVQRVNRFSLVSLASKRVHEFSRKVLVDEHLHAAA